MPEKLKNQIWASEFLDFSLLLKSNISNTDDDQYTIKFETKKGGQPSVVLAPNAKRVTLHSIDQWTSAFQIYVAIYTERIPERRPCTDEIWLCHPGACHLGGQLAVLSMRIFVNFGNPRISHGIKFIQSSG